ncbi:MULTISPECIES: hypothetical protein [Haloarcula]|uniref:hypothetical protein n=1 Tax=Haloarcula TaxID=2237 RepID=UPI0023E86FDB|nr:hypothetical protein [Halomicroarcula sp. SHR3]
MKVNVLTASDCPLCKQIKQYGILDHLYYVIRALPDVSYIQRVVGKMEHPAKPYEERGTLTVKDGQLSERRQNVGGGVEYYSERIDGALGTPMFLVESGNNRDSFFLADLVPDGVEEGYIVTDRPEYGSHLILDRIHRFYCRYETKLPMEAEAQLRRRPDELEQRHLGHQDRMIVPRIDDHDDGFQERRWLNAFTKAREPELA